MARLPLAALAAMLAGCAAPAPQQPPVRFALERLGGPAAAQPATEAVAKTALAPVRASALPPGASPLPATPAPAAPAGGGAAGLVEFPPVDSEAFLVLPDGRVVAVPEGSEVLLPDGLTGRVTHYGPGTVPATIDLPGGPIALHPRAVAWAAEPTGLATVRGQLEASGVDVAYHAAGRRLVPSAQSAADGGFALEVPIGAAEDGVLVARAGDGLGAVAVSLAPGAAIALDPIALAAPVATGAALPAPPRGMALVSSSLSAVAVGAATPWRVPLLTFSPAVPPPVYDLPGFAVVHAFAAESADRRRGSVTAGRPDAAIAFLEAPALEALPATLAPGAALRWPAVAGADLYTLRLTSAGATAPLWEAALSRPEVTLPDRLTLPDRELVLQVDAWDAPDVTVYSVASARALRIPAASGGPEGRHSWSRRAFGPASKGEGAIGM